MFQSMRVAWSCNCGALVALTKASHLDLQSQTTKASLSQKIRSLNFLRTKSSILYPIHPANISLELTSLTRVSSGSTGTPSQVASLHLVASPHSRPPSVPIGFVPQKSHSQAGLATSLPPSRLTSLLPSHLTPDCTPIPRKLTIYSPTCTF